MDKRILLLQERILEKLQSPPALEELATEINVSPSRLRQIFKAETGMPFTEYVRHLQMERARQMLETTFLRVQEISFAVGFRDQCHFNRAFKEKYGMTPKKYRYENHWEFKKLNENRFVQ